MAINFTNDTPNWKQGSTDYILQRKEKFKTIPSIIRFDYYFQNIDTLDEFHSTINVIYIEGEDNDNVAELIYIATPNNDPSKKVSFTGILAIQSINSNAPDITAWLRNGTTDGSLTQLEIILASSQVFVYYDNEDKDEWKAGEVDSIDDTLSIYEDKQLGVNLGVDLPPYLTLIPNDIVNGSLAITPLEVKHIETKLKDKDGNILYLKTINLAFNEKRFFINKNKEFDFTPGDVSVTWKDPNRDGNE